MGINLYDYGDEMSKFNVPIVLIMFKRVEKTLRIIKRISALNPRKIYLLSDEGRNEEEKELVRICRVSVENEINWDCEIVKNYANENRGVYGNIALGAKWVFEREEEAIFLEDDNLPEISFFPYCEELLKKYKNNEKILWICGTNYLESYKPKDNASYVFTRHMLPCGWASWATKFNKYYDFDLRAVDEANYTRKLKRTYKSKSLFRQQLNKINAEHKRREDGVRYNSWDYHIALSIRSNELFGISPKYNQIENIGVDNFSEHGGISYDNIMTKRFCGINSLELESPLRHPNKIEIDKIYERRVDRIILLPLLSRFKILAVRILKRVLGIPESQPFRKGKNK